MLCISLPLLANEKHEVARTVSEFKPLCVAGYQVFSESCTFKLQCEPDAYHAYHLVNYLALARAGEHYGTVFATYNAAQAHRRWREECQCDSGEQVSGLWRNYAALRMLAHALPSFMSKTRAKIVDQACSRSYWRRKAVFCLVTRPSRDECSPSNVNIQSIYHSTSRVLLTPDIPSSKPTQPALLSPRWETDCLLCLNKDIINISSLKTRSNRTKKSSTSSRGIREAQ